MDPHVAHVIGRIRADDFGGSAGMAREVALTLARAAETTSADSPAAFRAFLEEAVSALVEATISFAPVHGVLHRVMSAVEGQPADAPVAALRSAVHQAAVDGAAWIDGALARIGEIGQGLLRDGDALFTYSVSGTVWAIVHAARRVGKRVSVRSTEARPHNEGLQHIKELAAVGIPVTLGIDAATGQLIKGCAAVMVGADAVTAAGDALCKIGSLAAAALARREGLPFYITADTSKFQFLTLEGVPLGNTHAPVDYILPGGPRDHVSVYTPIFEVVPADTITAVVTEQGVLHPGAVSALFHTLPRSDAVTAQLRQRLARTA